MSNALQLEFKYQTDIELFDLNRSLHGIAQGFADFSVKLSDGRLNADLGSVTDNSGISPKLLVSHVESGSIIIECIAHAQCILPFDKWVDLISLYAEFFKISADYFLGNGDRPTYMDSIVCKNMRNSVAAIAKEDGRNFITSIVDKRKTVNNNTQIFCYSSQQCSLIQQNAEKERLKLEQPAVHDLEKVPLELLQVRNSDEPSAGDLAKIESVSGKMVKTYFLDKDDLIRQAENPFNKIYIVDVRVETVGGKPVLYKVKRLHDTIDREDENLI